MKKQLTIEMYYKPETYLPLSVCIEQIEQILKIQHYYLHKSENWYLCGVSKKKSSIYQLFDKNGVTKVGLEKLTQKYKKNKNSFSGSIWDKDTEEAALCYFIYEKLLEKRFFLKIELDFTIDIRITKSQTVTEFILALVQKFNSAYIIVNGNYFPPKSCFSRQTISRLDDISTQGSINARNSTRIVGCGKCQKRGRTGNRNASGNVAPFF